VRFSKRRLLIEKGYVGRWSEEIFLVKAQLPTVPVTHRLTDLFGEVIKGSFYNDKLQIVVKLDDALFDIKHVLKTRKRSGKVKYLVEWRGYPNKFNSLVDNLTRR